MNRRYFAAQLTWALIIGMIGCRPATAPLPEGHTPAAAPVKLTVSAAASVQDAMGAIQVAYEAEAPHVTLIYNFGASGALAQQINQGAPVDVFLSASPRWMDVVERQGLVRRGDRLDLLQNSMVLIAPQDQTRITDFDDLATDAVRKIALGEPQSVPAGNYAKEVLTALKLFDPLQPKLVFGKDVRQVVSYVATGNVDAGLVYATDVLVSPAVQVIATASPATHGPIRYPVAVIQASQKADEARAFINFLAGDRAISIFQDYGFTLAP